MIHAITATRAFEEANKRKALSRRCPKCNEEQIASRQQKNAALVCKNCGRQIPPDGSGENPRTRKYETK